MCLCRRPSSCLMCSVICSFLHSRFTQQTLAEHLLGARHCPRCWRCSRAQAEKVPAFTELIF
uniref:Uncharacterized protein n=1 Tax=Monodon monoceros TaxID=40151 RepID=A0A8C6AUR6_MONMO